MAVLFRKTYWTDHSKIKMKQYGLSVSKLLGILRKPERKERGIAPGTMAVMKTNKKFVNKTISLLKEKQKISPWQKRAPGEVWIMYKDTKKEGEPIRKIISAWRYPGVTKPGEEIPIPEDIKKDFLCGIID
jgi:hypothetical protein